jgi:general secretion pathway protein I
VGDTSFACEQMGRSYTGLLVTRPTPNPGFRRVDAEIKSPEGQQLLTLTTIVGRP